MVQCFKKLFQEFKEGDMVANLALAQVRVKVAFLVTIHGPFYDRPVKVQHLVPVKHKYHGASSHVQLPESTDILKEQPHFMNIEEIGGHLPCKFDGTLLQIEPNVSEGLEEVSEVPSKKE
jgi:hypothetical protein